MYRIERVVKHTLAPSLSWVAAPNRVDVNRCSFNRLHGRLMVHFRGSGGALCKCIAQPDVHAGAFSIIQVHRQHLSSTVHTYSIFPLQWRYGHYRTQLRANGNNRRNLNASGDSTKPWTWFLSEQLPYWEAECCSQS